MDKCILRMLTVPPFRYMYKSFKRSASLGERSNSATKAMARHRNGVPDSCESLVQGLERACKDLTKAMTSEE